MGHILGLNRLNGSKWGLFVGCKLYLQTSLGDADQWVFLAVSVRVASVLLSTAAMSIELG